MIQAPINKRNIPDFHIAAFRGIQGAMLIQKIEINKYKMFYEQSFNLNITHYEFLHYEIFF